MRAYLPRFKKLLKMTEIYSETGEVVNNGRTKRFSMWSAFLFFSTITLIASVEEVRIREIQNSVRSRLISFLVALSTEE
jgi:hypothetical protein